MNEDLATAKHVTHLLDKSAGELSPLINARLQASIALACEAHRSKTQKHTVSASPSFVERISNWIVGPRAAVAFSCAMVAAVTFGITSELDEVKVAKLEAIAELDAAILMDDLPTEAYLDSNFVGFTSNKPAASGPDESMERWLQQIGNPSS